MADAAPNPTPRTGPTLVMKAAVAAFMVLVVGVECGVAYFFIPSAEQIAAVAEEKAKLKAAEETKQATGDDTVEVDLKEFHLTSQHPDSDIVMRINFHLYGEVLASEQADFDATYAKFENRFRNLVIAEIRTAEQEELNDGRLTLIKSRILEKSNQLFGKPILKSVMFSNYTFIDQ